MTDSRAWRVWAPRAQAVELEALGRRWPMRPGPGDWWEVNAEARPGSPYVFVIDGGRLPDPRSAWQPAGVHGPSALVDHAEFLWSDGEWRPPPLGSGLVYELHVGTFTLAGTFDGAIARLDHLVTLGVTHVELMPVAEFPGRHGWGYDGVDLYAPHHAYGGPDGLKRLVDGCHAKGLAVLLDVVYNHLGPNGNYLARFGPYFTTRYTTPWGEGINFDDRGSDEVRRFFLDNALMWLRDYHIDGLRLDAVHAIHDRSATHFLEELGREVHGRAARVGRPLIVVAESDLNDPRLVSSPGVGGYGLDAQWNEDFHHALHALLTGERAGYYADFGNLADLASALRHGWVYRGQYSRHRGRRHGRPPTGLTGHQLVACLQNHDQVGNRARGERLSHLVSPARLRIGAALLLTAPFVPLLFQGEEWGAATPFQYFTDHEDPALADAIRQGRRREFAAFGWDPAAIPDPQDPGTFQRSTLDWTEVAREPHASLLDWHRRLVRLRQSQPALTDGRLTEVGVAFDETARWLVVQRGPIVVAANLGSAGRRVPLTSAEARELLLASACGIGLDSDGIWLPPDSVAIVASRDGT